MKLLLINNEFPPIGGGGSTVTKHALEYLVDAGHDVTLITSRYKDLPHREEVRPAAGGPGRGEIIRIPTIRRYQDFAAAWELVVFGLSALVYAFFYTGRHKVDFIQAYFAVPAGWVAWKLSYLRSIPYAVYFGGSDIPNANPSRYKMIYPIITPLLRVIWRRAKFRTVCSQELVRLARQADKDSEFLCIPNGVDTKRFSPTNRPANDKVKLLFIGRLIHRKGLQRVIKALPEVLKTTSTAFQVDVVGTGSYKQDLESLAKELNVSEYINYVGGVPYEKLETAYQGSDIFVLTSLSEGMPAVILEAMSCGLPVVASDVGGNNEIVQEGENGFLVQGDDTKELAVKLVRLINNKELRESMGQTSRQMALAYDWDNIMGQYNKLYQKYAKRN